MEQIQELITRVINGDTQAFEEIYQATYRQVYYTAFSFLKNEQNTLDVMQDTYITALTHLQQLENPERIVAWLNRIAVNKCKDFLMKKIPEPVEENSIDTELLEENDNFLPESYVLNAEKRKIILTIMQEELTAIQYQTILLYYFDGMSVPEIAACMECPEGTVKYRLSAARGKIKQGVQDYENTSGIKLYSSGSVALLTAIFVAESQSLVIPRCSRCCCIDEYRIGNRWKCSGSGYGDCHWYRNSSCRSEGSGCSRKSRNKRPLSDVKGKGDCRCDSGCTCCRRCDSRYPYTQQKTGYRQPLPSGRDNRL